MTASIQTATVVFTDLVASTQLRSAIGDERAEVLRRQHDTLTTDAVAACQGRVVKSLGDGFMAVFASASDAVHAADAIQRAFDRYNRTSEPDMRMYVRVGVAAGDVSFEHDDYHGMPVVQAARLCNSCDAGEILATAAVKWLAGSRVDNTFVELGPIELKGISQPTDCVRVEWSRESNAALTIPLQGFLDGGSQNALRGRESELAALVSMWSAAHDGNPQIALFSGEPGVGKTRLVTEFAARVVDSGGMVLAGRVEEGLGGPYQPFVEAIDHFLGHLGDAPPAEVLGSAAGELSRIIPDLELLVGSLPSPVKADPGTEQYRLAEAVASVIRVASEMAPVLLVIDDFHWCSSQTALLLRHVCTSLNQSRVMVAVMFRDTDMPNNPEAEGVIADLFRLPAVRRLSIEGIGESAVREIIEDAGADVVVDCDVNELARLIQNQAEGNAFFVNELIRHIVERGVGDSSGSRSGIPSLPNSVTEVVHRRLNRLSSKTIEMLTYSAVVGREFTLKLLSLVLGGDHALIDCADEAINARLLEERGVGRYRFVHQLVAETLLADLTATRRADMHLRLASAIERENASNIEAVIGDLAYHYSAAAPAGDLERTVDVLARAGDKALRQLAFTEAADLFERAIELLPDGDVGIRIDLMIALGRARSHAGRPDQVTLMQAARLAREIGDDRRVAEAALAEDVAVLGVFGSVDPGRTALLEDALTHADNLPIGVQARLYAELALELVFADTVERKLAMANRALELARQSQHPGTLARVLALRYPTLWTARTLDDRLHIVEELEALSGQLDDSSLVFLAAANGALVKMEAGDLHAADNRLATAELIAERLGEPRLRWFASICRAKRQIIVGELDRAEATALAAAAIGEIAGRSDAPNYLAAQRFCIGFHRGSLDGLQDAVDRAVERSGGGSAFRSMRVALRSEIGDLDAASAELKELGSTSFAFAADFTQVVLLCFCALGATATNDEGTATALYEQLGPHRGRFADAGSTWYGSVDHYLGGLARVLGREDDARNHYREAERLHSRVGSVPMLARTLAALAEIDQ